MTADQLREIRERCEGLSDRDFMFVPELKYIFTLLTEIDRLNEQLETAKEGLEGIRDGTACRNTYRAASDTLAAMKENI